MDLLTDLLQQAGLRRRLLDSRRLAAGTALQFPCDRSIGLHVVTHGRAWVHAPSLPEPLALAAGDIAVMARGCHHVLATQPALRRHQEIPIAPVWTPPPGEAAATIAEDGDASQVISGAYQFWNAPLHPFFREIPGWFVLRGDSLPKLGPLALAIALLDEEARQRRLGADTIVHGLLDVIFTYALREIVSRSGGSGSGWSHAVSDAQVRLAVAAMHEDCAHPWTLEELAVRAGLSRTVLAERFRVAMGDTPLAYLRTVRLQKAMRLLSETSRTLEQVAREVGYQDAFSFSKVFKRTLGLAPREFRQRDAGEQSQPWRFG
jgi:AraC-like DNA-binding protein